MKLSVFLGDVIRWIVGLVIMYFALYYTFVSLLILFDYLVISLDGLSWLIFFIVWGFVFSSIIPLFTWFSTLLLGLMAFIVRQRSIFATIISGLMFLGLAAILIMFWFGYIGFSWEAASYKTLNQIIFSFYILSMMTIPLFIFGTIDE